uniref:gamma-glutamylcyclotransferase family protein n=1 Tax=Ndongobacter massiliensis TaxID=1871025 RepID=UPI00092FE62A|nr:gamma-glutamylcyclotransferase family protein [Ndongobacter massiliensis]
MKNYVAYGSNMDVAQMARRCPDSKLVGKGTLKNYRFYFKGVNDRNYATVEKAEGSDLPILFWQISEADERELDKYEEYPGMYEKEEVPVILENGETKTGLIYVMPTSNPMHAPTKSYYRVIELAYKKFGFNCDILKDALHLTGEPLREERESLYEFQTPEA